MRRLASIRMLQRLAAAVVGLCVVGMVAAPQAMPARGEGPISVAVQSFQNDAGAPPSVVGDVGGAAYRAISSDGRYTAKGGGLLPVPHTLTSDSFVNALSEAAKAGADEVLLGSVVQYGGGEVYYRLTLYRVAPVTFLGSQIFSAPYPPSDARSLSASLDNNIAALASPRQAVGTIFSTTDGATADLGSQNGFQLGDRFNVLRNGQKVADATISALRDYDATLAISSPAPGYAPAIGDQVVGLRALGPGPPQGPPASGFNVLAFAAAVGGALLAIGHHGQPGSFCTSCATPTPTASPFQILTFSINGHPPSGFIEFTFSEVVSATSQTCLQGNINCASFTLQPPGSQATTQPAPLSNLGPVTFSLDPTGTETIMDVGETMNGLVTGETWQMFFTSQVLSVSGAPLLAAQTGNQTMGGPRKVLGDSRPHIGPVAPGPQVPKGQQPAPKPPPPHPQPPSRP